MKKIIIIFPLFFLIIILGGVFYFYSNLQGVCQKNCQSQVFVIPQGATLNEVLNKLENEKMIKNARIAKIYLKLKKWNGNIQAGDFKLNPKDSLDKIIANLQKGTLDFWVTIPEGFRAEQVYEKIQNARGVIAIRQLPEKQSSNMIATSVPTALPRNDKKIEIYTQNEGYLFPDTYLIPRNASDEDVVLIMKNNFFNQINAMSLSGEGNITYQSEKGNLQKIKLDNGDFINLQELITLASLVEREAKNDEERPIIANIIYKRWKADWPLQIDATIQYIVGKSGEWWKKDLTFEDLKIDNPYNTYLNKGLPPGPICNPGLKAIEAVVNQTQTDFWFYATGDDGVTRFTKTLGEHNQNVEKNIK